MNFQERYSSLRNDCKDYINQKLEAALNKRITLVDFKAEKKKDEDADITDFSLPQVSKVSKHSYYTQYHVTAITKIEPTTSIYSDEPVEIWCICWDDEDGEQAVPLYECITLGDLAYLCDIIETLNQDVHSVNQQQQ